MTPDAPPGKTAGPTGRMTLDPRTPNAIGRAPECRLQILNRAISKVHAEILLHGPTGAWRILSHGKNGTSVNGDPVRPGDQRDLSDGDELELAGMYCLVFRVASRGREAWLEPDAAAAGDSTVSFRYVPAVMRLGLAGGREILEIDTDARIAVLESPASPAPRRQRLVLQRAEYEVLSLLALHAGRAVPRGDLQEVTSEKDLSERLSDSVYRHVSRLKRKLGPFGECLRPVHGVGYVLEDVTLLDS